MKVWLRRLCAAATLLCIFRHVQTYSMGAPDAACKAMKPDHETDPQKSPPPYHVMVSTKELQAGRRLRVTLGSSPGAAFEGYLLQGRDKANMDTTVGTFFGDNFPGSILTCGRGIHNAVTHNNKGNKTEITVEWESPRTFSGTVIFRATFVANYKTFWVNVTSEDVTILPQQSSVASTVGSTDATSSATQTTTTTTTTAAATTTTVSSPEAPAFLPPEDKKKYDPIYEGCFNVKNCFGYPADCEASKDCEMILTYTVKGEKYSFEMKGNSRGYIAMALSEDRNMGDDSVVHCFRDGESVQIQMSWNYEEDGRRDNRLLQDPDVGLSETDYSDENGWISCKFTRKMLTVVEGKLFDLSKENYVLMLAMGAVAKDGKLKYHDKQKLASSRAVSLASLSRVEAVTHLFIKLHGAFMIAAWLGLCTSGILLARYFKRTWMGQRICAKDTWFACHRLVMMLTWMLTIAAFTLIFVELGGWTSIPITENPHSILGCVTTGLAFIQPLMALCRPGPDARKRPVFNWMHWIVGNLALISAFVTIFFAVALTKAEIPTLAYWILVAVVAFYAFTHIVFMVHQCHSERKLAKRNSKLTARGGNTQSAILATMSDKEDSPGSTFRKSMLFIYLFINWILTTILILFVVLTPISSYVGSWVDETV